MVSLLLLSAMTVFAVLAARIDYATHRLPNRLTAAIFLLGLGLVAFWLTISLPACMARWLVEWFVVGLVHLGLAILGRGALGMGDVKFIAGLALPVVWWGNVWLCLLLAYCSGALWGLSGHARQYSRRIAFGPHLAGGWIVVVVGQLGSVAMAYSR